MYFWINGTDNVIIFKNTISYIFSNDIFNGYKAKEHSNWKKNSYIYVQVCSNQNALNDVCTVVYRKLVHCFNCSFVSLLLKQ